MIEIQSDETTMGSSVLRRLCSDDSDEFNFCSESKQLFTLGKYNENKSSRPADHLASSCAMIYASVAVEFRVGSIKSDEKHSLFRVTSSNSDPEYLKTSRKGDATLSLPVKQSIGYLLSHLHLIIEGIVLLTPQRLCAEQSADPNKPPPSS